MRPSIDEVKAALDRRSIRHDSVAVAPASIYAGAVVVLAGVPLQVTEYALDARISGRVISVESWRAAGRLVHVEKTPPAEAVAVLDFGVAARQTGALIFNGKSWRYRISGSDFVLTPSKRSLPATASLHPDHMLVDETRCSWIVVVEMPDGESKRYDWSALSR